MSLSVNTNSMIGINPQNALIPNLTASNLVGTNAAGVLASVTSSSNPTFTTVTAASTSGFVLSAGSGTTIKTTAPGSAQAVTIPPVAGGNDSFVLNTNIATLTNKTLTTPTVNGAALTGTFSGAPTFSGVVTASAGITSFRTIGTGITGTSYTFALTDGNRFISASNAGTQTLTVDTNANVAFVVGTEIDICQTGAGQVVFAAAGGVTINSVNSLLKIGNQNTCATLKKLATDTWLLVGNLSA